MWRSPPLNIQTKHLAHISLFLQYLGIGMEHIPGQWVYLVYLPPSMHVDQIIRGPDQCTNFRSDLLGDASIWISRARSRQIFPIRAATSVQIIRWFIDHSD